MPNHVKNIIESSEVVIQSLLNDEGFVDFNNVLKMPEILENTASGSITPHAKGVFKGVITEEYLLKNEYTQKQVAEIMLSVQAKKETGYYNWYEWKIKNWDTKWNAYDQALEKNTPTSVTFDTAWAHPLKIIEALSLKFPDEKITAKFADEDLGSNCGTYTIQNGNMLEQDIAPSWSEQSEQDKKKWTAFAFKIKHPDEDPKEYGYDDNWDYIDD
ncbi:hypothetical protein [Thorsellia anophelis]|uniref:YubB ferredoxin-like domain-containing protein n=1 Tax=Thorsellia anophelis DSM 18579 TaxID=1123402 RepID=A0A1I0FPZ5_9GAMM|nr:hypothetical protein [Thorsellia anophelis]SET60252.1 hypothetical protein SAMN02583745_02851 [Thorsellia anophelis DSM 18579]